MDENGVTKLNYFLIPGNPPAVQFYELWGREFKADNSEAKIRVSNYPLLDMMNDASLAMDCIFEEHLDQLKKFIKEVKAPVTIIGHSLGGHFALRLLQDQHLHLDQVILLHPFLKRPSLKGQLILKLAGSVHHLSFLQSGIVKNRKRLEIFSDELTFLSDEEILKSFHIARHEALTIGKNEKPIEIPLHLQKKVRVFYTKNDTWCGVEGVKDLIKIVEVTECEEPHGFVTQSKFRKSLYQKIVSR